MTRRSFGIALVGLLVMGLVGLYGVGWELSRPVPARIGPAPVELQAEAITFRSESGSMIRGWLSRGTTHGGVVLLLPGVRANRLAMVDRALVLHAAGYSTLLIDFQATGESPGDAITFGWRERLDVIAAVQTLRRMLPGEPIGIIGTSLGGAATLLAAPALDVQAVVLEAVYPSIEVAVENRLRMRFGTLGATLSPLLISSPSIASDSCVARSLSLAESSISTRQWPIRNDSTQRLVSRKSYGSFQTQRTLIIFVPAARSTSDVCWRFSIVRFGRGNPLTHRRSREAAPVQRADLQIG